MAIGWNLWGMLPHLLPHEVTTAHKILEMAKDPWKDPDPQPGNFDAELDQAQVEIHEGNPNAELSILLSRLASRATEMRILLRHACSHGGNAAEQVKRTRPPSTRD